MIMICVDCADTVKNPILRPGELHFTKGGHYLELQL